jgi:uncharacterized peroxidase-related enzyme
MAPTPGHFRLASPTHGAVLSGRRRGLEIRLESAVWERELFAAFTSRLNQCVFLTRVHGAVASKASGDEALVASVLEDWRSAPVEPPFRAMLGFFEKLTRNPDSVTSADVVPRREAGLTDDAIEDAIHVRALFHVSTRLADTFEFDIPPAEGFGQGAVMLLKRGYTYTPWGTPGSTSGRNGAERPRQDSNLRHSV